MMKLNFLLVLFLISCSQQEKETISLRRVAKKMQLTEVELKNDSILSKKLPIKLKKEELNCHFGDGDVIDELRKAFKTNQIIVTLEPLFSKNNDAVFSAILPKSSPGLILESGIGSRLTLDTGVYGLFVCTDVKKTGRCSQNKIYQINDLIHEVFKVKDPSQLSLKPDLTIYFKPVVLTKDSLFILDEFTKNKKDVLVMMSKILGYSDKQAVDIYKKIRYFDINLSNMPLYKEGSYLVLDLPGFGKMCSEKTLRMMHQSRK